MIAKAIGRYLRISPRKARAVIALIKGRYVDDALAILSNSNKKAAHFLRKLLNSAAANAKRLPNMRQEDLYISNIFADGGPSLKRFKAQALGRAAMIKRRSSHITVELDIKEPRTLKAVKKTKGQKQEKAAAPKKASSSPKEKKQSGAEAQKRNG